MENWKKFINEEGLDERCQKGYKTHETRKTKKMYGKTYRNCVPNNEGLEEEKDSESEEDEEELKKIKKELEGASKMHKGQADRIGDIMKEEAVNPNKIAKLEAEYVKNRSAAVLQQLTKLAKMGKYDMNRLRQKMKSLKEQDLNEIELEEKKKRKKKKKKKKAKKRDACYHKVKARYDVWPSAYASGALVKCRKVGAANWGKSTTKKENLDLKEVIIDELRTFIAENGKGGLRDWFKQGGWVDVVDGDACAREKGETATPKCVSRAKRASMSKKERESAQRRKRKADPNQPKKSGGAKPTYVSTDKPKKKKSKKKESFDMQLNKDLLVSMIKEEYSKILQEMGAKLGHAGDAKRGYDDWNSGLLEKPAEPDNVEYMKGWKQAEKNFGMYREGVDINYYHITDATYDDGTVAEGIEFWDDVLEEAEYQGRKVTLNKPMRGDVKKSKVYVKNAKGNVVKVNFGDKKMKIKKSNPKRRKSFRARHNCKNPGPKWKARYWSCKAW